MVSSSSIADTGIKFVDIVGKMAGIALQIDRGAEGVDSVIGSLAGFIPYYSQAMTVLRIADPILAKINAAAPAVSGAIDAGRPVIEAFQAAAPSILPHIKDVMSIAFAHAPGGAITVAASSISDSDAMKFAGSIFERSFFSPQDPRFNVPLVG